MFNGNNSWNSNYSAITEKNSVQYILASHFDEIFISDIKETFENCMRIDSGNTLVAPLNLFNFRVINMSTPVMDSDGASKSYVDNSIYRFESIVNLGSISGNIQLQTNKQYQIIQSDAESITFNMPSVAGLNKNVLNQIMIDFQTAANSAEINLGTENYLGELPVFDPGIFNYTLIYEFSNNINDWCVGAVPKGAISA
jgi:hypothetical protein